jgi:predicted MFS family arabinose efflux permease
VKYSYRTVTVVGGLFASVGMIATYFATSVGFLYVSYGAFVGIGAGLSFPPTVYIVTSYFLKYRGLANGICISGSAIGSIILPPVLRYLLETFGYRGAILIMGGVTLNTLVAAIFYEPVEKHMKRIPKPREMQEVERVCFDDDKIIEESEPSDSTSERFKTGANGGGDFASKPRLAKFIITSDDTPVSTPTFEQKTDDIFRFPKNISIGNGVRSVSAAAVQNYEGLTASRRERKISQPIREDNRNASFMSPLSSTPSLHHVNSHANRLNRFNRLNGSVRPPKRSPSTSSFQYVSTPYHGSTLSALQPNEFASHLSLKSIASSLYPVTDTQAEKSGSAKFFDLSLLRDPAYLVILISNCTNAIGYTNFIILLPAYAINLGFDKSLAAYLLSIVSSLDLVGRIGGSALSDLNLIPKTWYFVGGLAISGLSLAVLPFARSYLMISIFCAFFGLASGTYVGITGITNFLIFL